MGCPNNQQTPHSHFGNDTRQYRFLFFLGCSNKRGKEDHITSLQLRPKRFSFLTNELHSFCSLPQLLTERWRLRQCFWIVVDINNDIFGMIFQFGRLVAFKSLIHAKRSHWQRPRTNKNNAPRCWGVDSMDGRKLHACEINIVLIIWKLGQPSAAWRNVNF